MTSFCFTNGLPNIGGTCILDFGSQGAGGSERGIVDVIAPDDSCSAGGGSADPINAIVNGATGTCIINQGNPPTCDPDQNSGEWYDCIASQSGNAQQVRQGVQCRITGQATPGGANNHCQDQNPQAEGACDALPGGNGDGVDDFSESVTLIFDGPGTPNDIYEPRDCNPGVEGVQPSPRIGSIFILPANPNLNQNDPDPIIGFAGFYLLGCKASTNADPPQTMEEKKCDPPGPQGHIAVFGTFVNLITSGGGVGPPNPASTLFGIGLVE
jgi:hypothetical protein